MINADFFSLLPTFIFHTNNPPLVRHLACMSSEHLTLLVEVYMRLLFVLTTNFIPIFQESDRVVTKKEGINFARESGCLFIECSAKTRVNVQQCFEELVLKV